MKLSDRIKRLIEVAEDSTDAELDLLLELLDERRITENAAKAEKTVVQAKPKRKKGRPKKKTKQGHNKKYSDAQIIKAVKLRKKGVSKSLVAKATGIKKGSLTNSKWLNCQFEKIQKKQR